MDRLPGPLRIERLSAPQPPWLAMRRALAELASDALLENTASHAMHRALGFEEAERVVCFRRAAP